ncbi:GDSL esterase/lipase At4g10955-like [Macadamia integrifolia]|uniref:GDSL esterase/lipase At4g10955-like n=1 Tax=Macadamia integrifolia TaxID=60698 RepID=UPI001C52B407|nr:GDSL esterase/lipase At4g10955-like [Macadamia integrifolia]
MAKSSVEGISSDSEEAHPYAFHISGPRNVSSPSWRDLINSSWKDANYRRTVIACFIQAVYLLELDRQENRVEATALAPKWWKPFKYKLSQVLLDERDGSIFGAILEWDRSAALADFILIRPSGAPSAVLVLRGTLLKSPTIRRDIEDDLRFLAWESLKGSVRFNVALNALKSTVEIYGSCNVCIAGHSLGAGFALQVGKALAKQGVFVETHLFNPPSVSLAMSLRTIGEKAEFVWKRFKSMLPSNAETQSNEELNAQKTIASAGRGGRSGEMKKWIPHLYVNNSDYVCCYYTNPAETTAVTQVDSGEASGKENKDPGHDGHVAAKLFVMSKGKQKFLEAHGLQQWWSDDLELQLALHNSELITKQLKSLYTLPPPPTPLPLQSKPR